MWVEPLIDAYQRRKHELEWLDAHCWLDPSARDRFRTFEDFAFLKPFLGAAIRVGINLDLFNRPVGIQADAVEVKQPPENDGRTVP